MNMTPSRVPRLSDLILLWLDEKIGKGHKIKFGDGYRYMQGTLRSYIDTSDYKLMIDGILVGWIYETHFEVCSGGEVMREKLMPEDPLFFDKLWAHMEQISADFDVLYQEKLTTYLKEKHGK